MVISIIYLAYRTYNILALSIFYLAYEIFLIKRNKE